MMDIQLFVIELYNCLSFGDEKIEFQMNKLEDLKERVERDAYERGYNDALAEVGGG